MDLKEKFKTAAGDAFFVTADRLQELEQLLQKIQWLDRNEKILTAEKPGDGNMNLVLRIKTNQRSFIIKQSRPWVEKYPQIDAPLQRIAVEAQFYELTQRDPYFASITPKLLGWNQPNYLLALEDLGETADFLPLYERDSVLQKAALKALIEFITHLHHYNFSDRDIKTFPDNLPLRRLNHEHIFHFPYLEENGFDLDTVQEGLQQLAMTYKTDHALKSKITALGELYLQPGPRLIHGDYYPGSWLKVSSGVKIIDPEFAFFGLAEFDIAVAIAHFRMAGQEDAIINQFLAEYPFPREFNPQLCYAFSGVETMRRIIGIAQLPLTLSLDEKAALLKEAKALILAYS